MRAEQAVIAGAAETPYRRGPVRRTTQELLADVTRRVLRNAGMELGDIDGLGVTSLTLAPDRAIGIRLSDLTIGFDALPAADQQWLEDRMGQDAPRSYETTVGTLISDVLKSIRRERERVSISVLGLPVEPGKVSVDAAQRTNEHYGFLIQELGADVNVRDAKGYTPLHHAAARGDRELILYLLEHGADVKVISRRGQSTADMANGPVQRVQIFPEIVELLVGRGSELKEKAR